MRCLRSVCIVTDMDIDPSSLKRAPISPPSLSSSEKRRKYDAMSAQQENINNDMNARTSRMYWGKLLQEAEDDESEWNELSTEILCYLSNILEKTGRKSVIPPQTFRQAENIVAGLTGRSLEQWKDGVRKGVKVSKWEDLVHHRACCRKGSFNAS